LFRPGKLTPVHIDYIDGNTIQDISKFYFGKELSIILPEKICIPTSKIIELALELSLNNLMDDSFGQFEKELYSLMFRAI